MDQARKAITDFEWKSGAPEGSFRAVIASFDVIDKDGDLTLPNAFVSGTKVVVSPWGHTSMDGALPVGTATITADGARAYADGQFLMNTPHGKAAYQTVKQLSEDGIQQWSYGYRVRQVGDKKELAAHPGAKRILKEVLPFEVSPVLIGAGEGVFTQSIKSERSADELLEEIAAAMSRFLNEQKAGASVSRANLARLNALKDELAAFIAEHSPQPDPDVQAADAKTAEDINRIWERIEAEEARTSLFEVTWVS